VPCTYTRATTRTLTGGNGNSLAEHTPTSEDLTAQQTPASSHVSGPDSPYLLEDSGDIDPAVRRLLELQLLQHFIVVIVETFPGTPGSAHVHSIWTIHAIALALEHSFLLNAIFAISALHIAIEDGEQKSLTSSPHVNSPDPLWAIDRASNPPGRLPTVDYAKAHRFFLNRAVREQRQALSVLNGLNAGPVLLTSILLSMIAARLIHERNTPSYSPPVQWLSMANAIGTILRATAPLIPPNTVIAAILAINDPDFRNPDVIFDPAFLEQCQPILSFDTASEGQDEETMEVYKRAVTYAGGIYRAIRNGDPVRQVCRRILSIGPVLRNFSTLLAQKRPRALVILAHLMAMAKHVESFWWFYGAAEREVYGIQSILPQEWQWAMRWPLETLRMLSAARNENGNGIVLS
jgi:hypothetical protein